MIFIVCNVLGGRRRSWLKGIGRSRLGFDGFVGLGIGAVAHGVEDSLELWLAGFAELAPVLSLADGVGVARVKAAAAAGVQDQIIGLAFCVGLVMEMRIQGTIEFPSQ